SGKQPWALRIGVHTGPVVAGVVGKRKFAYDIWGDTVNTASRMESSGEVGEVNISGATYHAVKDHFDCVHRGQINAKNKGSIDMYFVVRIKPEFSGNVDGTLANARFLKQCGTVVSAEQLA
ncbi:MAG TPA: adenylate/guanylate cyclase domain-containing protein, partial [Flavobacteriales bacterium]|nr:adenylate/guanylate cyclase domain-containing protein [Flavobacteriales bacterium]